MKAGVDILGALADMTAEYRLDGLDSPQEGGRLPRNLAGSRVALAISAAGFAFMGQYLLSNARTVAIDGLILYGVAIACFLPLALRYGSEERPREGEFPLSGRTLVSAVTRFPIGAALVVLALGLAFTALRLAQSKIGNDSYLDVAAFWVASAVMYGSAFIRPGMPGLARWLREYRTELMILGAVVCVASALRFIELGTIPATVSGDEGAVGNHALSAFRGEINSPFGARRGHGTLYLMAIGLPMQILGQSTFSLRALSALSGVLTVVVTYLLARRLFGPRVALVSAVLVATSHIHIHLSRISDSGAIVDSLFASLALYFLIRAVDDGRPTDFVLCGFTVALHLCFYNGGKLMAIVLVAYLGALALTDRRRMLANRGNLLVLAGAFLIASGPMLQWALAHPDQFMDRSNQMGIVQSGWLIGEAARTGRPEALIVLDQFYRAMLAFIYYPAVGFYGARIPMFDLAVAIPFVLGLAYSIARTFDRRFLLLNTMFFLTVVFGQAALVEPEHNVYRILVVLPVAVIMAALGVNKLVEQLAEVRVPSGPLPAIIIALYLVAASASNINYYYRDWAGAGNYPDPATRWASVMGTYLGALDRGYKAYLYGMPGFTYGIHPSVDFLSGKMPVTNVTDSMVGDLRFVDRTRGAVFVFVPQREKELEAVQRQFPGGIRRELPDIDNRASTRPVLITYEVPRLN